MNRSLLYIGIITVMFFAGGGAAARHSLAATEATPAPAADVTPAPEAEDTPVPSMSGEPTVSIGERLRSNLLTDRDTLHFVSMGSAIYLYEEPSTRSTRMRLANKTVRGVSEFIVLSEETTDGRLFYKVRSTFSADTGYVLARDTHESKLEKSGVTGYARVDAASCFLLSEPKDKSNVLAKESEHFLRILGQIDEYYYVITERGNFGYVLPSQIIRIDAAELAEHLARVDSPAILEIMDDPLTDASAANAAKMLRAGTDSTAVRYWSTAQAHVAQQGWLKKATIAMLTVTAGGGPQPAGRDGIQFQPCSEVPPLSEGDILQQGLDFNLHGSIYTNSPIVSVTAQLLSLDGSKSVSATVTFATEDEVCDYSLASKVEPQQGSSLDKLFDISRLRTGRYQFTLTVATVAQPEPVTLLSVACEIVPEKRNILTQNQFDDNFADAYAFFGGDTTKFLFRYTTKDGRYIATDTEWREAHIVISSLGRVHIDAVPNFETANHYLETSFIRVSVVNRYSGELEPGNVMPLKELVGKAVTYVPRFQSNLGYISHHTLGTAIDVNDDMYPNKNKRSNHDIIGDDVKNHLTYNGIQTDETGVRYYDFTYDGTYPARFLKIPKTIVNYLLYELAFYRAGFEWGYYYETTCDAMHFMLTENDINRHLHSDIGLRKVYDYIEPEWTYVPPSAPAPDVEPTPAPEG